MVSFCLLGKPLPHLDTVQSAQNSCVAKTELETATDSQTDITTRYPGQAVDFPWAADPVFL